MEFQDDCELVNTFVRVVRNEFFLLLGLFTARYSLTDKARICTQVRETLLKRIYWKEKQSVERYTESEKAEEKKLVLG